ncbi:putative RNA-directed DNA polymerase from transposon X-element [Trichonephila clavipes]|nr:putative RNA-directed DNA polymerase from transposon X-element [Trichonephila clavipes]
MGSGYRVSLLQVYQALIFSRLDYGCVVYGSARTSVLKRLDTIHHSALRICSLSLSGAFRTSPVTSLYVVCHQLPLELRRRQLSANYFIRTMSVPSHPLKPFTLAIGLNRLYEARSFHIKPFSERAKAVLNDAHLNNINIQENNILAFPPWDIQIFNYHNPFSGYDKAGTAAVIYQQLFSFHRKRKGFDIIFSWVPGHVGILGNEQADTAARSMSDHMQRPVCYQDLKTSAQNYIHRVWQETWDQQVLNKLHNIHPSTSHWAALPVRRHDVRLTRLRIGHTRFTHRHLLLGENAPECPSKSTVAPVVFKRVFAYHRSQYSRYSAIYTDGSKRADYVGCGVVIEDIMHVYRLDTSCSVFTAEAVAIYRALKSIDSNRPRKYCIYTDSMSVLEALENYNDRCHLVVCKILGITSRLYSKGFDIVFCWLPSHVGIIGNEQADSAAKSATTHLPLAVPLMDMKRVIMHHIFKLWQESWSQQLDNKLHSVKPVIGAWPVMPMRRTDVKLTRLRIGHTRFTHRHLLLGKDAPACPPVTVSPHKSLNSCRGVISEPDLLGTSDSEILEGFSDQGVTQVRRITIKKDSTIVPTKHLILTFNSPKLPNTIKAGYLNCKIRPYIPNPLRCFKCQRFGHSQTSCRGQLTCSRCASAGHASSDCTLEQKCVNCSQPHSADSKLCPKWKIEKEIQTIKTNRNISYIEARKFITPQPSQTYVQVAKSITVNSSSQTDETITKIVCSPLKLLQPLITISKPNMSSSVPAVTISSTSTQAQLVPSTSSVTVTSPSISQPPNSAIDTVSTASDNLSISTASSSSTACSVLETTTTTSNTIPTIYPRIQLKPQNPVGKNVLLKTNLQL